jgi:hypothetical protein
MGLQRPTGRKRRSMSRTAARILMTAYGLTKQEQKLR